MKEIINNWFGEISDESYIEQGDIFEKCCIILPNHTHYLSIFNSMHTDTPLEVTEFDGIVLSQTCDIINKKISSLILCPIFPLSTFKDKGGRFNSAAGREDLRQGKLAQYHLLQKFETKTLPMDYYYVDFQHIYSIPKQFLEAMLKNISRKRLLSPYREHLSQSFARYFMRVGLPTDIPQEDIKNYT